MENYIYYCYKNWLKKKEGSLIKQISKLKVGAIILLSLLLATLIGLFVILSLAIGGVMCQKWAFIFMALETVLIIILSIYCEKTQVSNSNKNLLNYKEDCNNLKAYLLQNNISIKIIPRLIERYNAKINTIEEKIEHKHNFVIKFVELLLIPVSALILGAMLDKKITISDTLSIGITGLICLCFIYGLIIFALYLNDVVMRYPESTYKQLVSDLQSIVDFEECQVLKLVNGCTVIALDETKSVKS